MPKHLLNFQLLTKTPLELLHWSIYSLNYTYLSNQHTSYSLLKTQTESNCQLPHHWQLPWFLSLFFQSPTTCKKGRHCSVHLFWFQWKFVIFPLFVGLFSLSLSLSLSPVGIWLISNLVVWYWVLFLLVVYWVFIEDLVCMICSPILLCEIVSTTLHIILILLYFHNISYGFGMDWLSEVGFHCFFIFSNNIIIKQYKWLNLFL